MCQLSAAAGHHPQSLDRGSHCKVPSAEALYFSGRRARRKEYYMQGGGLHTFCLLHTSFSWNTVHMDVALLTGTMCAGSGELLFA